MWFSSYPATETFWNFVNFDSVDRSFANQGFAAIIFQFVKQLNDYLHSQSSYLFSWFCVLSLNSLTVHRITFGLATKHLYLDEGDKQQRCFHMTAAKKKLFTTSVLARNLDSPVGTARVFAETKAWPQKFDKCRFFFKKKAIISHRSTINLVTEAVNPKHLDNPAKFYTVCH